MSSLLPAMPLSLTTSSALVAVTKSPGGEKGAALAVEVDALTFFWEEASVKE